MAICVQTCPSALYPQKTHQMMAHHPSQESFMSMETQGEGNYASTVFSDTRDHEINQGLTLSPKIQLNDPWLFDAAGTFQDQDLDALLGPVEFDPTAAEARNIDLDVDFLFNDRHQLDAPPAKRRKLTPELREDTLCSPKPGGPTSQREIVIDLAGLHNSTKVFQRPVSPDETTRARSSSSHAVLEPQQNHISCNEVFHSDTLLPIPRSGQCNGSEELGCSDDDGSLFGDCAFEAPLECSPTAERSLAELDADLEAELEADLEAALEPGFEAKLEAELCSTNFSPTPLLWNSGLRATNSSSATTTLKEGLRATDSLSPPFMLWDPNATIPSVERERYLPKGEGSVGSTRTPFKSRPSTRTTTRYSSRKTLESRILELEQKLAQVSSAGSQNLASQSQNRTSVSGESQTDANEPSTLRYDRTQLPLHVALSLASPDTYQSISRVIQSAPLHSGNHPLSIVHQIPDDLKKLLESLHRKFNSDPRFQESTILWIFWKMVAAGSGEAGQIQGFFRGMKEMSREELEQALFEEKRHHVMTKAQLEQALKKR